jgi:hypothetical protein
LQWRLIQAKKLSVCRTKTNGNQICTFLYKN